MRNRQCTIRDEQPAVGAAQLFSAFIRNLACLVLLFPLLLSNCTPTPPANDQGELTTEPVPRLAKYYPEVNSSGDTSYKKPPFITLVDQNGKYFSTSRFSGKIEVVQIFFASCRGICPIITNNMCAVQKEFAGNPDVKMLSYSVDPARDSASVLREYADHYHVDSTQWKLLTGGKKEIYELIRFGYLLPDIAPGNGDQEDFIHSDQLVLVDRNSIIRGYYGGTDSAQVKMLIEDIHTLLNEK